MWYTYTSYVHIHTCIHVQRNITFTYCSNSRGFLSAPMTLVILFTLYDSSKDSRKYRGKNRVLYSSLHDGSARNFMPRSLWWKQNISYFVFFPVPFYVSVYNLRLFSITPPRSSLFYRGRRRDYKRNYTEGWTSESLSSVMEHLPRT